MAEQLPLTIEIVDLAPEGPVVIDRVLGATPYLEEAKRIGRHLLSIRERSGSAGGYRVLSADQKLLYSWDTRTRGEH
jgi:hypothetical protein